MYNFICMEEEPVKQRRELVRVDKSLQKLLSSTLIEELSSTLIEISTSSNLIRIDESREDLALGVTFILAFDEELSISFLVQSLELSAH